MTNWRLQDLGPGAIASAVLLVILGPMVWQNLTAPNLVNAITLGALYALIAVGYTMVYGIIKLINFAHGEIYMLGAYWALLVVGFEQASGMNLFVALVPAMLLCAMLGFTVDWSAYLSLRRRLPWSDWLSIISLVVLAVGAVLYRLTGDSTHTLYSPSMQTVILWVLVIAASLGMFAIALADKVGALGRSLGRVTTPRLNALITAIGMSLILQQLTMLIFGSDYRAFPEAAIPAFMNEPTIAIGEFVVRGKELIIWVVTIVMMVGLQLIVGYTRLGSAMRACAADADAAQLMGISVDRVIAWTFVIGSAMAAVAGILYAAKAGGNISFRMGYYPGLLAFAAAVLGGIGNLRGAVLGGVLIGLVQGFTNNSFAMPFLVMVVVLIVRPWGILGKPETTRA